jgi:hypothetical protein
MSETKNTSVLGTDVSGRAYALTASVKAGDLLEADGDFDCIAAGSILIVQGESGDLWVSCSHGKHGLDGQDDGDGFLVGFYPVPTA